MNITDLGVEIDGRYYIVQNNYQTAKNGQLYISHKDMLAANFVRRRSKKLFFIFILAGSAMVALDNFSFGIFSGIFAAEEIIDHITIFLAMLAAAFLIALAFSRRPYIELTFIGGVIRVPLEKINKVQAKQIVQEIRNRH